MKSYEQIAAAMYHAYCKQAGGKTFDGKPLPTYDELGAEQPQIRARFFGTPLPAWNELGADRQACWEAAARQAAAELALVH